MIGTAIISLISYLCPIVEQYEWEIDYALPAPPVSVMFFFFLVVMLNTLLFKFSHPLALNPNELLLIYAIYKNDFLRRKSLEEIRIPE